MYLPQIFVQNADAIRELEVDNQRVEINVETLRKILPDIDDILPAGCNNVITRKDLFNLAPREPIALVSCTKQRQEELRRFFILVMIWGWGRRGRGIHNIATAIASSGFPEILCRVTEECYYGMFLLAYETLLGNQPKINGFGPPFATKFLYFFCHHFHAVVRPQILDSLVVATMRSFNWPKQCPDFIAHNSANDNTLKSSGGYGQYLILMHNWASTLNCRPDQLEYFMWTKAKRKASAALV